MVKSQSDPSYGVAKAMKEIAHYLDLKDPDFHHYDNPKEYEFAKPKGSPVEDLSVVELYLTTKRMLSAKTLSDFQIEEGTGKNNKDFVLFPSYATEGSLLRYKWLGVERKPDGGKYMFVEPKDSPPCLFGWQALDPKTREVTIDEGEINAMTLHQYGHPALAVPFGAGKGNKHEWIEYEFDNLARFDAIYIRADNDEPGRQMVEDVSTRLGRHRCRHLKMPHDPNECLQKGFTKDDMLTFYEEADYFHPPGLRSPNEFTRKVIDKFYPLMDVATIGFSPKFRKLRESKPNDYPNFSFRPDEWTVLAGIDGSGKSHMADIFLLDGIHEGMVDGSHSVKGCIASMEMQIDEIIHRQARKILGVDDVFYPNAAQITEAVKWLNGKLWLFDPYGADRSLDNILNTFEYAIKRFQCNILVIDSLMCLPGVSQESNDSQAEVAARVNDFVNRTHTHLILIMHVRKLVNAIEDYDYMSISGSKVLTNLAHNVILLKRNTKRERCLDEGVDLRGNELTEEIREKLLTMPTASFCVQKQRNGSNWLGTIPLWWYQPSRSWLESYDGRPRHYLPNKI
jgi:twinkle protein